jgi:hypothetical protein
MKEATRRSFLKASAVLALAGAVGVPVLMTTGCNGVTIAQDIVNWTPALQSSAATVAAAVATLQPMYAAIIATALTGFDAATNLVVAEAKAYLANPGQTVLQALQTGVITLQQQVNSALLAAVKIVNPQSQQLIIAGLNAVATAINSIFALILQVKGNTVSAAVKPPGSSSTSSVRPIVFKQEYTTASVKMIQEHYDVSFEQAHVVYVRGLNLIQAEGF